MKYKKIVITGAGSGIGKQAAICLARQGHTVYATTQFEEECTSLLHIAQKEKLSLLSFKLDITNEKDIQKLEKIEFDTFINNAAIGTSGSIIEIDIQKVYAVFQTNIFATLSITQFVLKKLIEQNHGTIIFVSSLAGIIPIAFLSPYCASKSAINNFASSIRQELKQLNKPNIKIKLIELGAYHTGFNQKNYRKKYEWMKHHSYFKDNWKNMKEKEEKLWEFIEYYHFNSAIKKYMQAVHSKNNHFKYTAPKIQSIFVKFVKIMDLLFSM